MLNQVILVGRITVKPSAVELDGGHKKSVFNIAVPRSYKNAKGEYDTDFIRCVLWDAIASSTVEYCKMGDIVGVKGRLETREYDDENGKRHYVTEVIAERVTFLSSKTKEEIKEKEPKNEVKKESSKNKKKAE